MTDNNSDKIINKKDRKSFDSFMDLIKANAASAVDESMPNRTASPNADGIFEVRKPSLFGFRPSLVKQKDEQGDTPEIVDELNELDGFELEED